MDESLLLSLLSNCLSDSAISKLVTKKTYQGIVRISLWRETIARKSRHENYMSNHNPLIYMKVEKLRLP